MAAASIQERISLPPVYRHSGEGISLRHFLLLHLRRQYHSLLSILTVAGNITKTLAAASPKETIPLPPVYAHCGKGISLRHWLLPHLRRQYHSLLSIVTWGREYHSDTGCCLTSGENTTPSCLCSLRKGNITQTLAAASPQVTIPLPPANPHSGEGISLRHWLLSHLRRKYHSLMSILTDGWNITQTLAAASPQEQYHSLLPILTVAVNITQTLAAASPKERIPLHPLYRHWGREYHSDTGCCLTSGENTTPSCLSSLWQGISLRHWLLPHIRREYHSLLSIVTGEGISLRHWLLPHLRRKYHSLLSIVTRGRDYHSDTGCCLTSGDTTTPSCLSSLGEGISLRHWLPPHITRQYHSLLYIITRGREYLSDTGCCFTSGDNTTPSCLSSLRAGNITQTLAAASPQERIPLPAAYPHSGQGISLRHFLLLHLRRQYHSLLPILTVAGNITQTLAAASPQERIPLPPVYPHSGEGISLRHWLLPPLRREYHSLLSIFTVAGNITQTLSAASPQERIPLPPVYPHSGREYHSDTGCCLT